MEFTPQQEIKRKEDGSAAVEAGQGPAAMSNWPLLQFFQDLEGFDLVALLLGAAIAFFSAGFAMLMRALRPQLVAPTLRRLRSLSDDHRNRRRFVDHGRDGKRCR